MIINLLYIHFQFKYNFIVTITISFLIKMQTPILLILVLLSPLLGTVFSSQNTLKIETVDSNYHQLVDDAEFASEITHKHKVVKKDLSTYFDDHSADDNTIPNF